MTVSITTCGRMMQCRLACLDETEPSWPTSPYTRWCTVLQPSYPKEAHRERLRGDRIQRQYWPVHHGTCRWPVHLCLCQITQCAAERKLHCSPGMMGVVQLWFSYVMCRTQFVGLYEHRWYLWQFWQCSAKFRAPATEYYTNTKSHCKFDLVHRRCGLFKLRKGLIEGDELVDFCPILKHIGHAWPWPGWVCSSRPAGGRKWCWARQVASLTGDNQARTLLGREVCVAWATWLFCWLAKTARVQATYSIPMGGEWNGMDNRHVDRGRRVLYAGSSYFEP